MKRITLTIALLVVFSACPGQWLERNNGLYGGAVLAMLQRHDTIFATTYGGIYRSMDRGRTWARFNDGIEWDVRMGSIFECQGQVIISTTSNHQYQLAADRRSWVRTHNTLVSPQLVQFAVLGGRIFSRNNQGRIFRSDDLAASWQEITSLPAPATGLATDGESIFLSTSSGIYTADISATHWTEVPGSAYLPDKRFYFLHGSDGHLIAGAGSQVYVKLSGQSLVATNFPTDFRYQIFGAGQTLFAVSMDHTYKSTDGGQTWRSREGLSNITSILFFAQDEIFAGSQHGVFHSLDGGTKWTDSNNGLANVQVNAIIDHNNNKVFLATGRGIYVSDDRGSSWEKTGNELGLFPVFALIADGNSIVAGGAGIFVSRDGGNQWVKVSDVHITTIARFQGSIYAGSSYGLFRSDDLGNSWRKVSANQVQDLFVHDSRLWVCAWDDVRFSADGTNWTSLKDGLMDFANPKEFFTFQDKLLLGTLNQDAYILNEELSSWEPVVQPGRSNLFMSFAANEATLFMGSSHGVYHSTDTLKTFELINEGLPVYGNTNYIGGMAVLDGKLFAALDWFGVWSLNACLSLTPPKAVATSVTCGQVRLESSSESGNQWFHEGVSVEGANDQEFEPKESGRYSVATIEDGCMSDPSEPVEVKISSPPRIEMPNFFSPNGDAMNDAFRPIALDDVDHATLRIFDRTGRNVYETNDLTKGWNGGDNAAAVYFYQLQYQAACETATVKGWLHLMR